MLDADTDARAAGDAAAGDAATGDALRTFVKGFRHGRHDEARHSLEEIVAMLDMAMPIGVAILDANMHYVMLNSQTYSQLHVRPEDIGPGDPISKMHALLVGNGLLDRSVLEGLGREAAQAGEVAVGETLSSIVPLLDGRYLRLSRYRLPNGYSVSISEDVTELATTEALLEDAMVIGKSGYWIYDFATRHYRFSHSLASFMTPEQQRIARVEGPLPAIAEEDRPLFRRALADIGPGNGYSFEVVTRSALTRRTLWFKSTGRLIRHPDGRPHQIRCHVRDVTKGHLQRIALSRAKDEAVAANLAKSQFLANMSHEIRTPMNGVLGMAELLAGSAIDDRQREFVDVITRSATSLLTVINDILDFSKIEADALALDPHPFNLRDIVDEVVTLLSPHAADKGLELVVEYPAGVPASYVGDATRVRQVLTNLVGNAVKFTETGHVLLSVDAAAVGDGTADLRVDVVDTGIGIEADKVHKVFDKFTQADNSTTRIYGGTGLGLSIAKRLAEMMDGSLSVESVFGEGTRFSFRAALPLDKSAKPVVRNTGPLRGRRVLIVDDIDVNRRVLSEQLGGWGMKTLAVSDGVEALLALKTAQDPHSDAQAFDLAILDYLMPGVNGRELASMMEAQGSIDVPVLMLSSCDQQQVRELSSASGVDRYLVKPVREQALFDTVVGMIYSEPAEATAPSVRKAPAPAPASSPARAEGKVEILVAEDFPLNQDVVRLMLADTRYSPVVVANGQEAVDLFAAEAGTKRFQAVLMDISMPVMDGYTATDALRALEAERGLGRTPVVALTGHALTHEREKCVEAGMDDYLTKPVKQVELIAALDRWTGVRTRLAVAG